MTVITNKHILNFLLNFSGKKEIIVMSPFRQVVFNIFEENIISFDSCQKNLLINILNECNNVFCFIIIKQIINNHSKNIYGMKCVNFKWYFISSKHMEKAFREDARTGENMTSNPLDYFPDYYEIKYI